MIDVAIMIGISGSGKTTFSTKIIPRIKNLVPTIYSADIERLDKDGNYIYKSAENIAVHTTCRKKFTKHLIGLSRSQRDIHHTDALLIVDNTATTPAEVAFYIDLAKTFGARVELYRMVPPGWPKIEVSRDKHGKFICSKEITNYINHCVSLNVHDVPRGQIERMLLKLHRSNSDPLIGFPRWWPFNDVRRFHGGFSCGFKIWKLDGDTSHPIDFE